MLAVLTDHGRQACRPYEFFITFVTLHPEYEKTIIYISPVHGNVTGQCTSDVSGERTDRS